MTEEIRKCITGASPYGFCNCCEYNGVQCCAACNEDCNSRCGWYEEDKNIGTIKLDRERRICERHKCP